MFKFPALFIQGHKKELFASQVFAPTNIFMFNRIGFARLAGAFTTTLFLLRSHSALLACVAGKSLPLFKINVRTEKRIVNLIFI